MDGLSACFPIFICFKQSVWVLCFALRRSENENLVTRGLVEPDSRGESHQLDDLVSLWSVLRLPSLVDDDEIEALAFETI